MSELPPAYGGEILHVDLESGESEREELAPEDARLFLGGNGLAVKLVAEHVPRRPTRSISENVVVFAVGPMNATPFQSTSRGVVGFVSPMTDGFFDSTFGGTFPRAQKTTGFDAIALHGSADDLSYVSITADGATVEPAADLAGLDTYETCERVREQEGVGYDTHVIAAGPAGENRVRYACLLHESKRREGVAGRRQRGGSRLEERESRRRPGGRLRAELAAPDRLRTLATGRMKPLMEGTEMLQDYGDQRPREPGQRDGKARPAQQSNRADVLGERGGDQRRTAPRRVRHRGHHVRQLRGRLRETRRGPVGGDHRGEDSGV